MNLHLVVLVVSFGLCQPQCLYGGTSQCPYRVFLQWYAHHAVANNHFDVLLLFNSTDPNLSREFGDQYAVYRGALGEIRSGASQSYQNIEELVGTMFAIFMTTFEQSCYIPVKGTPLFGLIEASFDRILLYLFEEFRLKGGKLETCPPREAIQAVIDTANMAGTIDTEALINTPSPSYKTTFGSIPASLRRIHTEINSGDIKEIKIIMERQENLLEQFTDVLLESCYTMIRERLWTLIELDFDQTSERLIGMLQAKLNMCPGCINCDNRNNIKATLDSAASQGYMDLTGLVGNFIPEFRTLSALLSGLNASSAVGRVDIAFVDLKMKEFERTFRETLNRCYINVRAPMEDVITKAIRELREIFIFQTAMVGGGNLATCPNRAMLDDAIKYALFSNSPFDAQFFMANMHEFRDVKLSYDIFTRGIQSRALTDTGSLVQEFNKIAHAFILILANTCYIDVTYDVANLVYEAFDFRTICSALGGFQNLIGPIIP